MTQLFPTCGTARNSSNTLLASIRKARGFSSLACNVNVTKGTSYKLMERIKGIKVPGGILSMLLLIWL